jgi:hypothetical protein
VKDGNVDDSRFSVSKSEVDWIIGIGFKGFRGVPDGQQMPAQEAPDNVLPKKAGDLLRPLVPEANAPISIDNINAGFEVFEDRTIDFGIV